MRQRRQGIFFVAYTMSLLIQQQNKLQPLNAVSVHGCNNDDVMASMLITNVITYSDPRIIKLYIIGSIARLRYHHVMTDCVEV